MWLQINPACHWLDSQDTSWEFRVQQLGGSVDLVANSCLKSPLVCIIFHLLVASRAMRFSISMWALGPGGEWCHCYCLLGSCSNQYKLATCMHLLICWLHRCVMMLQNNRIQCLIWSITAPVCTIFGISCQNGRKKMMKQKKTKGSTINMYYLWPKSRTIQNSNFSL